MAENTERQLIESINAQKKMKQKTPKGFGKVMNTDKAEKDTDLPLSTTIKITDSVETNTEKTEAVDDASKINNAELTKLVNSLLEPLKKDLEQTKKDKEAAEVALKEAKEAADNAIKESKESAEKALKESEERLEAIKSDLSVAKNSATILEDLGKLMGKSFDAAPQQLQVLGEGSQQMRDYEKLLNQASGELVNSAFGFVSQKDLRSANQYWAKNKQAISEGVEKVLKDAGFLQGANHITNAPTVVSDIPSVAFQHLSNFVRENTFDDLVHSQFFTRAVKTGTSPSLNTSIPNYPFNTRPTTKESRQLTPGVAIFNSSNPVTERQVLLTIEELGLGKDTDNQPLGLTSFVTAFSMQDLEALITRNLGYDYNAYLDLRAYTEWFGASTIIYPGQIGGLITASGDLTANDGLISRSFLINLSAFMKANRFATFMGGFYGYMHNPGSWAQYASELSTQERFVEPEQKDLVSKLLQTENNGMGGVVSGFKGIHDGFMHFMTNSYGVGAAGSTGATEITVGGSPVIYDSNFAFGSETIAEATALPVEIRSSEITDYNRRSSFIWYSHQGFVDLNVNADAATGKERRVVQVRNRRTIG